MAAGGARARGGAHAGRVLRLDRATPGEAVSRDRRGRASCPGAIEMMDKPRDRGRRRRWPTPGYPLDAGAALLVELDGAERRVRGALRRGRRDLRARRLRRRPRRRATRPSASCSGRRARPRSPRWAGSPRNYYVQDGVIPRTRLPEVLERIDELAQRVRAAGGQRLPRRRRQPAPARLLRRPRRGRGGARRGAGRAGSSTPASRPAARSPASTASASTRSSYMPKMFGEADLDAFQRLRCAFDPDGAGQPRQGDADAAAVRRGARPLPRSTRSRRPAWRSGSDGRPTRRAPGSPEAAARCCAPAGAARARRRRRDEARLGRRPSRAAAELRDRPGSTAILEHNAGDLTAVLQAGVPLARGAGERSPADGPDARARPAARTSGATIGGLVATGDSGPLRHRYGGLRDLVLGITVALSDGTLAKAGGKVIKNVAGLRPGQAVHRLVRHARR